MALSAERDTPERSGNKISLAVAAAVIIYAGALVARDADGNATPGDEATTILGVGRAAETVDNSDGSAGDVSVTIEKGIFRYKNSASTDAIAAANIGSNCYIVDDETVALTNGSSSRSVAGKIHDVDSQGVWVDFR